MSDTAPYGTLQNPDEAAVTANALVGERAGSATAHQVGAGFGPAAFSTAPYIPPRPATLVEVLTCRYKNCRQPTPDGSTYCERHQP